MPERITPTRLRADLYRILDEVLRTGRPVHVNRKGRTVRIEPVDTDDRLVRLRPHPDAVCGDPETLDGIGWEGAWSP